MELEAAFLSNPEINAFSTINLNGKLVNDAFYLGDCFILKKNQPYLNSKTKYEEGGGTDFYVPFPKGRLYTMGATSNPPARVERIDDYSLKVTVQKDGAANDVNFNFAINTI